MTGSSTSSAAAGRTWTATAAPAAVPDSELARAARVRRADDQPSGADRWRRGLAATASRNLQRATTSRASRAADDRFGAEFLALSRGNDWFWCGRQRHLAAQNGAIPANIAACSRTSTIPRRGIWRRTSIATTWQQAFGNYTVAPKQVRGVAAGRRDPVAAADPEPGVRYDFEHNALRTLPRSCRLHRNRPDDKTEIGPRMGFAFRATDHTVIRGGYGLYFGTVQNGYFTVLPTQTIAPLIFNDGRANFAANPWNGPTPGYEAVQANVCTPAMLTGCYARIPSRPSWPRQPMPQATRRQSVSSSRSATRSASRPTMSSRRPPSAQPVWSE